MSQQRKIKELRPSACGTRFGDVVAIDGKLFLKIKCRRCTKTLGKEVFHLFTIGDMMEFSERRDASA